MAEGEDGSDLGLVGVSLWVVMGGIAWRWREGCEDGEVSVGVEVIEVGGADVLFGGGLGEGISEEVLHSEGSPEEAAQLGIGWVGGGMDWGEDLDIEVMGGGVRLGCGLGNELCAEGGGELQGFGVWVG
ncbi:MAG: hypothetical protein RI897_774 [Verrucomicrobiota bacterium]